MAKEEYHPHKGKGWMMLILGLLVLGNTYWNIISWDYFIGILLVLGALCKMTMCKKK